MTNPTEQAAREFTEAELIKVIEGWKHFWMNQIKNTGDQADHDNYFRRAFGVDANMKYNLAKRLLEAFPSYLSALKRAEIAEAKLAKVDEYFEAMKYEGGLGCVQELYAELDAISKERE